MGRRASATIPLSEFAEDHGVTVRTITNWCAEGMPHRVVKGERRVVRSEANRWVRDRERERAKAEVAPDEAAERARKLRAEADLKELELARMRRHLVPVAEYEERLETFVGGFAAVASGQLTRFERDMVQATDAPAARRITQAIHAALMRGAQDYAATLEAEQAAVAAVDDVTADAA